MAENFKKLFEKTLKKTEMRIGKIVKATIIDIDKEFVWVDAGLKSEATINIDQFKNDKDKIKIGDSIDVVLDALDNNFGETCLSREKAKRIEIWTSLEKACENKETIMGKITNHVRGGYTTEIKGLRAFLPGSLVDVRPLKDISHIEDKNIELKIVKLDTKRNNIVVSRRAVIEDETKKDRDALFEKLKEGSIVKGIVKNITDFGAFIDLGGIDGLLHITDMSWSRIKHPNDMLSINDEINVKIIKFDNEKNRISLGIKQLGKDPWSKILEELSIGTKLIGKVTNITDYGCFVKLKEGIEGLVHTSELDWTNKNSNPHKFIKIKQEVEVMVLEVDSSRHRISLSIKQCKVNPWKEFAKTYKIGNKVTGKIRSITDFGIFIGLKGNIDGLIHISDISWKYPENDIKKFKKGENIKAITLSVDIVRERISLGIKQLVDDPFSKYIKENKKGSIVKGTVISIKSQGIKINLKNDVEGFVRLYDIEKNYIKKDNEIIKIGKKINTRIINIDLKRRSLNLSFLKKTSKTNLEKPIDSNIKVDIAIPKTIGDLIKKKLKK